jgi:hypothetical protein
MTQQAPQTPTCWFCGRRPPERDSASEWEMHRETGVKDEEVASIAKPEWEPVTVPVPRCAECKRAHDRRESFVEKGWKVGLLVGLVLLAAMFLSGLLGATALGARLLFVPSRAIILTPVIVFGSGVAGGIVGWLFGKSSLPPGVRDQGSATLHPNIRRMEEQGWKIGAKPRV